MSTDGVLKAARGETRRLWRVEVPCALAFVRVELLPSVWSVCMCVCMYWPCICACLCAHVSASTRVRTLKIMYGGCLIAGVKAAVIPPWGWTSLLVLPWPFCSQLLNRQRTGIRCGVSLKENIHYSSQEKRECSKWAEEEWFLWEKIEQTWVVWMQGEAENQTLQI